MTGYGRNCIAASVASLIGLGVLGSACSSVLSQKDPTAPMEQYKTYRWVNQSDAKNLNLENPNVEYMTGSTKVTQNPGLEKRIRPVIDQRFEQDGYHQLQTGTPDFFVSYYGKAKDRDWVSTWTGNTLTENNVPIVIFPGFNRRFANKYQEGTVYLVIYDAHSKSPAWSGNINRSDFGPDFGGSQTVAAVDQLVDQFKQDA